MLAHFFMIWDEVNGPLLFFFVWLGDFLFYFNFFWGGEVVLLCFALFFVCFVCCCCTWTQFVRTDFVRARILHTGHTEVEQRG